MLSRHPGGRPSAQENLLPPVTGFAPRLPELQITRRQSSQWQQIAGVLEPVFEAHISTTRSRRHELTTASALKLARQHRPRHVVPPVPVPMHDELNPGDRFDVADAAALPWPDGQIDLIVCSPPYALDVACASGDVPDYAAWLQSLSTWLTELLRVANPKWGRLCLNVPLDRDLGGWEPVSADAIQVARAAGWQFRTWIHS